MERKTKFLEDAREVKKELICMKGEKIRLEELRMKEKINLEKERFRFEQPRKDGRMHIEEERMRIEHEKMR
jgi:hypothetical protein